MIKKIIYLALIVITFNYNNIYSQNLNLTIKLYIEGYYDMNLGQMRKGDPIKVSLMNPSTHPPSLIQSMHSSFDFGGISNTFFANVTLPLDCYIKINHRNSIETWSQRITINSSSYSYDFTDLATKAYGNNMSELPDGTWGFFSGDVSDENNGQGYGFQDGVVSSLDYSDVESAVYWVLFGSSVIEDLTGDGIVESDDYVLIENNTYFTRHSITPP